MGEMSLGTLPDLNKVTRVLIVRLSSIGDVTHALPVSAALKDAFPHLEITWVVEEMSAQIVLGNPCLKDVIVVPRSRWKQGRTNSPQVWREYLRFLSELRARRFEVTIDLQGYAKSAIMALASGARHRVGWSRMRDGANLVSRPLPKRPESVHRVDWFLDVARALGADPKRVRFPLAIPEEARTAVATLLFAEGISAQTRYAVLNPAVGDLPRRWGAERYAELAVRLAERYDLRSVLIGSGKDVPICNEVIERVRALRHGVSVSKIPAGTTDITNDKRTWEPVSLAGKTSLKELGAVLESSAVHVCGDTGSAHIAAALERPVVALYGPTDPSHAGPWNQSGNVLSHRELCRPECTARRCAVSDPASGPVSPEGGVAVAACLRAISVEDVLEKVETVLHGR